MRQSFIKKYDEFKAVTRAGKTADSKNLRAKYSRGKRPGIRLGVIVSKGNIPSAARRNRVKRVIKEAFRTLKGIESEPIDIVVFAKSSAVGLKFEEAAMFLRSVIGHSQPGQI